MPRSLFSCRKTKTRQFLVLLLTILPPYYSSLCDWACSRTCSLALFHKFSCVRKQCVPGSLTRAWERGYLRYDNTNVLSKYALAYSIGQTMGSHDLSSTPCIIRPACIFKQPQATYHITSNSTLTCLVSWYTAPSNCSSEILMYARDTSTARDSTSCRE